MAFHIQNRSPSIPTNRQPFGSSSPRGVTQNASAFGTPFGGQSGGVTGPSSFQQQTSGGGFGNNIRSVADRNEQGFGPQAGLPTGVGGRTGPDGVWRPFSPAPQQPGAQGGDIQLQGPVVSQGGLPTNIQTSIEPSDVFSQNQTQQAVNQATADSIIPIDFAMKQFIRPGSSRSNSTLAAALPTFASGLSNAAAAQAQIPLADRLANLNNQRFGEVGRENEFNQLANLGTRFAEQDQFAELSRLQSMMQLAGGLL